MSTNYILSRRFDPLFAMACGIIAAGVRINREEKEKGKTTEQSIESFKWRWALAFGDKGGSRIEQKQEG